MTQLWACSAVTCSAEAFELDSCEKVLKMSRKSHNHRTNSASDTKRTSKQTMTNSSLKFGQFLLFYVSNSLLFVIFLLCISFNGKCSVTGQKYGCCHNDFQTHFYL